MNVYNNLQTTQNEESLLIENGIENKLRDEPQRFEIEALSEKIDKKISENKIGFKLFEYIKILRGYLFDKNVRWYRKAIVVTALIYFLTPLDSIPDFTPIIGFLDDLGVITWAIGFLGRELISYYAD